MLVAVHPVGFLEDWVFGDFQSLKPNPDEHRIQPIEPSQLGMYVFPGTQAPEQEVYANAAVRAALAHEFGIDAPHVLVQREVTDHHKFSETLADEASTSIDYLRPLAVKRYLDDIGEATFQPLVQRIHARMAQ